MSLAAPSTAPAGTGPGATTRAALIAALATVNGLTPGPYAPDVATAGAAWPRWIQTTYQGHLCAVAKDDFDVYVVLPADYIETTVDQGDAFRDVVAPALTSAAVVNYAEPVAIQFNDNQTMPGLRFRVTSR